MRILSAGQFLRSKENEALLGSVGQIVWRAMQSLCSGL